RKIESIISRGGGEEDPDCPGCLEETKFWVITKRTKTEATEQRTDEEKHKKYSDTVKKEISVLAGFLIDLNTDERPRVREVFQDLNAHDDRLRTLAKRCPSFSC
ncbi:unnamed protein product, partial [Symbiodinium pilosum]